MDTAQNIPTEHEFMEMLRKKTRWYTGRGPIIISGLIAGAQKIDQETIGNFGEAMAIAFQIRDQNLISINKLSKRCVSGSWHHIRCVKRC